MNILRVANEKDIPWFELESQTTGEQTVQSESIDLNDVNTSNEVDDAILAEECEKIESYASNGGIYRYNAQWDGDVVRHLREYASVCGMDRDRIQGVDPSCVEEQRSIQSSSEDMVKTAQTAEPSTRPTQKSMLKNVWEDPFHIDERSDTSHIDPANWEQVQKEAKLEAPSIMTGGVIPIDGGEDYFKNSDINPAPNQNSITEPDAIGKLANSKCMDNGERLKQEKIDKETEKSQNHKNWEQEKIQAMTNRDIVPQGNVFPTESLNAHTGLNTPSSQQGVYAKFDPNTIPERTAGEKIREKNEEIKQSIQRPKEQDNWENPSRQSSRSISNTFADSLAKKLNKK